MLSMLNSLSTVMHYVSELEQLGVLARGVAHPKLLSSQEIFRIRTLNSGV